MKPISIILWLCLILSCRKGFDETDPARPVITYNAFNWCKDTIVCWGDSYTNGGHVYNPYPYQLSQTLHQVVINCGIGGETSMQIRARFEADSSRRLYHYPTIIWAGANNSFDTVAYHNDIDSMVAKLGHDKFFIVSVLPQDSPVAWKGDSSKVWEGMMNYVITRFANNLGARYGKHAINLLPLLHAHAAHTARDSMCVVHNVQPYSLTIGDGVHLNDSGYAVLKNEIVSRLAKCN